MKKYDYIHKENNLSKTYYFFDNLLSYFPSIDSIFGIIFYSCILYFLSLLIRMRCTKKEKGFNNDDENNEIQKIKEKRNELLKNPNFIKKLESNRKKKSKEAMNLLNTIKNQ